MKPIDLIWWRDARGETKVQAAKTLGLSRNAYASYEAGNKQIPLYIALACAAIAQGLPPFEVTRHEEPPLVVD